MKFRILFLLLCLPVLLFANGAGIDGYNAPYAGHPRFIQKHDIKMLKEKVNVKFTLDSAYVHITYTFVNNASADHIKYGFPIDYYVTGNLKIYEEDSPDFWQEIPVLDEIHFILNGKTLDYTEGKDIDSEIEEKRRRWYYTDFSIDKGSSVQLEVKYKVHCGSEDFLTEKSSSEFGARHFYYDFDAGQYWGNGTVDEFEVEADFNGTSVYDIEINGLPLIKQGDKYIYKATGFSFKSAKQLEVIYEVSKIISRAEKLRTKTDTKLLVTTSTELKDYPAKNLTDGNFNTAWAAKDNGINQSIEFDVPTKEALTFALYNGYLKSEETYYNNSRIKQARIDVYSDGKIVESRDYYFTDSKYHREADFIDMAEFITVSYHCDKIKITILDVYPGNKYNEVCISEIAMHSWFYAIRGSANSLETSKTDYKMVVKAAAELKDYSVKNLIDNDFTTAWVAKDSDIIGKDIEISIPDDRLYSLVFYNGYLKSKETYYNNSRIRRVHVKMYHKGEFLNDEQVTFPDNGYHSYKNFWNMAMFFTIYKPTDKVVLTMLDVYPGEKYKETCISEIILLKQMYE